MKTTTKTNSKNKNKNKNNIKNNVIQYPPQKKQQQHSGKTHITLYFRRENRMAALMSNATRGEPLQETCYRACVLHTDSMDRRGRFRDSEMLDSSEK